MNATPTRKVGIAGGQHDLDVNAEHHALESVDSTISVNNTSRGFFKRAVEVSCDARRATQDTQWARSPRG